MMSNITLKQKNGFGPYLKASNESIGTIVAGQLYHAPGKSIDVFEGTL